MYHHTVPCNQLYCKKYSTQEFRKQNILTSLRGLCFLIVECGVPCSNNPLPTCKKKGRKRAIVVKDKETMAYTKNQYILSMQSHYSKVNVAGAECTNNVRHEQQAAD